LVIYQESLHDAWSTKCKKSECISNVQFSKSCTVTFITLKLVGDFI